MQSSEQIVNRVQTGWSGVLARTAAAVLLFETVSGLLITFGPFRPAIEWGLLLHTLVGLMAIAPLAWYFARHWKDYAGQALSDVLVFWLCRNRRAGYLRGVGIAGDVSGAVRD